MMSKDEFNGTKQIILKVDKHQPIGLPEGSRLPLGWPAIGISPDDPVVFHLDEKLPETKLFMRVSIAQETWDKKLLHVGIPETKTYLGTIDIRSSSVLVPYELEIGKEHVPAINKHGLEVWLEASEPLWIFDKPAAGVDNSSFLPHLIASTNENGSVQDFLDRFMSVSSVQAFGWREGTVLDGLWQLYTQKGEQRALDAIKQHLDLYFDADKNLVYETARSVPRDNQIDGIESTIPFATLARLEPKHPILNIAIEAWDSYTRKNGMVTDGMTRTAEGCYTVAYPMAVIGKAWKREDLMKNAIEQLKHRFVLIEDGGFYLRYTEGDKTYRNWARGAAWFLLGFARTISELKDEIQDEEVNEKFREGIDIALAMQREDGLWSCFMHEDVLPDTSGSAGISAAILTGIQDGILPESYREATEKCWKGLQKYITPDGFLKGVAQDNRGGIELQQSDYRVIAQMGMGMMAQLYAARENEVEM
jgi:rhamnogalacturonyl hydrolase YesR